MKRRVVLFGLAGIVIVGSAFGQNEGVNARGDNSQGNGTANCTRIVRDTESIEPGKLLMFCNIHANNVVVGRTGIHASPNQLFSIEAMGKANLASDGPYITNADGTITTAPPVGSGAYGWFTDNASPIGLPPVVGMQKFPLGGSQLDAAPFGSLVAGFSSVPNPTSLSDFPSGFQLIGTSGTATAPPSGGYLFFAVNDEFNGVDNSRAASPDR